MAEQTPRPIYPKLLCKNSYPLTSSQYTLPKTLKIQLIIVEYGQIWNEAANRVNGWDRKAANQRTEIFRAELNLWDQFNYFYAGLADESHEPQIKALGKYLKEQKILTIRIFKGIGGLGDPDKDGIIYQEWELLENRKSVSYQQNGFEFCAAASITKIKTIETTTVAASVGTLASPQCPNCLTPPPTPPRPDQTGSEWAGWEKIREQKSRLSLFLAICCQVLP